MLLSALLLLPAFSQVTEYTSRAAWEAVVGTPQCADFTGYGSGTVITNQYASIGMTFTQGDDTVLVSGAFVTDGVGVNCNGDMEIVLSSPHTAIGCDFPGRKAEAHRLVEKLGSFGGGEAQVGGSQFGQLAPGAQAGQGQVWIFTGSDDQVHLRWQVFEQKGKSIVNRR